MLLFSQPGPHNTNAAAVEGIRKAKQLNTDLVFASSSGATAEIVIAEARKQGFTGKLIDVRSVSDAQARGLNRMDAETKRELEAQGVVIVTAGHALSSGERGLSRQFSGVYPLEIMAATLRTLGQGVKVCFECAVMALDADVIEWGKPVVALGGHGGRTCQRHWRALGGTASGADTAIVITPGYSASILTTRIHEILCKPALMPESESSGRNSST